MASFKLPDGCLQLSGLHGQVLAMLQFAKHGSLPAQTMVTFCCCDAAEADGYEGNR